MWEPRPPVTGIASSFFTFHSELYSLEDREIKHFQLITYKAFCSHFLVGRRLHWCELWIQKTGKPVNGDTLRWGRCTEATRESDIVLAEGSASVLPLAWEGDAEGEKRCLSRQADLSFLTACLPVHKRLFFCCTLVLFKTHPELSAHTSVSCLLLNELFRYGAFWLWRVIPNPV